MGQRPDPDRLARAAIPTAASACLATASSARAANAYVRIRPVGGAPRYAPRGRASDGVRRALARNARRHTGAACPAFAAATGERWWPIGCMAGQAGPTLLRSGEPWFA